MISSPLKYVIIRNREAIIESLNTEEPFITKLVNQQMISKEFYTELILVKSDVDRNARLLDLILQYSDEKLLDFKKVFKKDQPYIDTLFTGKYIFDCHAHV